MPIIVSDGFRLLLVKDNDSEIHVGKGARVQYKGPCPDKNGVCGWQQFIGTVCESRVQQVHQMSVYTGIYITPEYVYIDSVWHKIVTVSDDPHLLVLSHYDHIHNTNPIYTMDTVTKIAVDLTRTIPPTIELVKYER